MSPIQHLENIEHRGSFANHVNYFYHPDAKLLFVLKTIDDEGRLSAEDIRREVSMPQKIHEHFRKNIFGIDEPGVKAPGIVETYGLFERDGREYAAIEFVDGMSLTDAMLSTRDAIKVGMSMFETLYYTHKAGISHRDANIFNWKIKGKQPVLIDWSSSNDKHAIDSAACQLGFASPQLLLGLADRRADTYAMGANLTYLVTGELPYQTPTVDTPAARAHLAAYKSTHNPQFYVSTSRRDIPQGLIALTRDMQASNTEDRPSIKECYDGLAALLRR